MNNHDAHTENNEDRKSHATHASHGTAKSYLTGFFLSIILTSISFYVVMAKVFEGSSTTAFVVLASAAVQIIVHMIYFLHMNTKSEGGWTLLALIFTIMLVAISLSGSIWVMYHLNHNMMPGMSSDAMMENVPNEDHTMTSMAEHKGIHPGQ
jgi:cytochrome o ubiquinol oxidase operon protein cyoD